MSFLIIIFLFVGFSYAYYLVKIEDYRMETQKKEVIKICSIVIFTVSNFYRKFWNN